MSTSDGAQGKQSSDDPVLSGALSAMAAEGSITPDAGLSDLGSAPDASQSAGAASAAKADAPTAPTGDDGSGTQARPTDGAPPKDPEAGAAPAAADPLAGTEPFTVTTNGQTRTLDGIYRVPGEGLLVPADRESVITSLVERAELADALDRTSREVSQQNATLERASRWDVTDEQGKVTQTLTGVQGLEARHVNFARMEAAVTVLDGILEDPAKLLALLDRDAQGTVFIRPDAVETLQMRIVIAANTAAETARGEFLKLIGPQAEPQASSGTPDYAASAPKLIDQSAGADAPLLSADDRSVLTAQIDRYVRAVTEEDRRYNPKLQLGAPIVDAKYGQLVQHIVAQRKAAKAESAASEKAGKFNAGAERGRQPAKPPAKPVTPQTPEKKPTERKRADWDTPLADALAEMGVAR